MLCEHEATLQWTLLMSNRLFAMCHDGKCNMCSMYVGHISQGVHVGKLDAQPPNLANELD